MDLCLNGNLTEGYPSASQKARVLTEAWVAQNMFCPVCGNSHLNHFENNRPVADFFCSNCASQYELKSKQGELGTKIVDGAYSTMIRRITGNENPDFLFMSYSSHDMVVNDLIMIPRFFFVPDVIEKRAPLAQTARRAGWVGCIIHLEGIPKQGKIEIIRNGHEVERESVLERVRMSQCLRTENITARGWLLDVLSCVNKIEADTFTLEEMYRYEDELSVKHPENHNIRPKIRQQLQVLRDKGLILFQGNGRYRKALP